jgi:hypothetical protein
MSPLRSTSVNTPHKAVPPSQMDWNDERLAALGVEQLKNLLANLGVQRAAGRVTGDTAADLTRRIAARLPANAVS